MNCIKLVGLYIFARKAIILFQTYYLLFTYNLNGVVVFSFQIIKLIFVINHFTKIDVGCGLRVSDTNVLGPTVLKFGPNFANGYSAEGNCNMVIIEKRKLFSN